MFTIIKNSIGKTITYSIYDTISCSKLNRIGLHKAFANYDHYDRKYFDITCKLYKKFKCKSKGMLVFFEKNDAISFLDFLLENKF